MFYLALISETKCNLCTSGVDPLIKNIFDFGCKYSKEDRVEQMDQENQMTEGEIDKERQK